MRLAQKPRRRSRRKEPVDIDPIVGYELSHYIYGRPLFVYLGDDISGARSMVYDLSFGTYTTKDMDFRPIRASERQKGA